MRTTLGEGSSRRASRRWARLVARFTVVAGLFSLTALSSRPAWAGTTTAADRETARGLLHDGDEKFASKHYSAALQSYEAAHVIMGYPSTGFAVAKSRAALGLLVEARDMALTVTRMPVTPGEAPAFARAREAAEKLADELSRRVPTLELSLEGGAASVGDVQLTLDGESIPVATLGAPRKVNPGKHTVSASATGYLSLSREVEVREGENSAVRIRLVEDPQAAPAPTTGAKTAEPTLHDVDADAVRKSTVSPLVYIGFGVGAAGLITGTVSGILHLTKVSKIESDYGCTGHTCTKPGVEAATEPTIKYATIADVAMGIGLAGAGVGVLGLVLSKPHVEESSGALARPKITADIGFGSVTLNGSF